MFVLLTIISMYLPIFVVCFLVYTCVGIRHFKDDEFIRRRKKSIFLS